MTSRTGLRVTLLLDEADLERAVERLRGDDATAGVGWRLAAAGRVASVAELRRRCGITSGPAGTRMPVEIFALGAIVDLYRYGMLPSVACLEVEVDRAWVTVR